MSYSRASESVGLGLAPLPQVSLTMPGPLKITLLRPSWPAPWAATAGKERVRRRATALSPVTLHIPAARATDRQEPRAWSAWTRIHPSTRLVSPLRPVIPHAGVEPGRTGQDGDAGARRSQLSDCTPLTTQVSGGGPRLRQALAPSQAARPPGRGTLGQHQGGSIFDMRGPAPSRAGKVHHDAAP